MKVDRIIEALGISRDARVDQRVPKRHLLEQGAPTAGDKRHIQEGIEELGWIAALKPTNIGVPAFRDDAREYLEIAVLTATLRVAAKTTRLVELIHRAIPYPLLLIAGQGDSVSVSLAHKRWSQNETGRVVIEGAPATAIFGSDLTAGYEDLFLATLALVRLPNSDLFALYQGWLDRVVALEAARITGSFVAPDSGVGATTLRQGVDEYARLERNTALLRAQAAKEKQLNRRVTLNLEIRRLEAEMASIALTL